MKVMDCDQLGAKVLRLATIDVFIAALKKQIKNPARNFVLQLLNETWLQKLA